MAEGPRTWPAVDLDLRHGAALPDDFEDRLALALDDLGATAFESSAGVSWRIYFEDGEAREGGLEALTTRLATWVEASRVDVPDQGWAVRVQAALGAVRVGDIIVAPPWDAPAGDPRPASDIPPEARYPLVIVIEPSMGFGTGHHQSTRLCLRILQRARVSTRRVIDVGTGSGVLAIAAIRLGARAVLALDNDPDAVRAARENAERNGVAGRLEVRLADLAGYTPPPRGGGDVVVANLTMSMLRRHCGPLTALVNPGGLLIASGFTADQVPLVLEAFPEFELRTREDEDDWVGLALVRRAAVPAA